MKILVKITVNCPSQEVAPLLAAGDYDQSLARAQAAKLAYEAAVAEKSFGLQVSLDSKF